MARRTCLACGLLLAWLWLSGCGPTVTAPATTGQPGAYPPPVVTLAAAAIPTAAPSPTPTRFVLPSPIPTATPTALSLPPSATPACQDGLRFVSDLTIPDGTVVTANTAVDKRWQVENSGTCNWDGRYRLRRISGPALGLPDDQALYPARGGTPLVIRMLLQAPAEPGVYRSAWQAVNPAGVPFGDPIFVEVVVGSGAP